MSDAVLVGIFGPLILLLVGFILTNIVAPMLNRDKGDEARASPAPVVGETVVAQDGWQAAYDAVMREIADERADHEKALRLHSKCHELLLRQGITPPHE